MNSGYLQDKDTDRYYYHIEDDLTPECWCYVNIGGRDTGKTYSDLRWWSIQPATKKIIGIVKRTNKEVEILCKSADDVDLNPYKSINRDYGTKIRAAQMTEGIGVFHNYATENPEFIGYALSLNALKNIRGMGLDDIDVLVFDEFIPTQYDKVFLSEGQALLDLYVSINRDREHRGKPPLLLIMNANAYRLWNPILDEMDLITDIANMKANGESKKIKDGVMIHLLDDNPNYKKRESQTAIMRSFKDTTWAQMALNNDFAFDDVSYIRNRSIKGFTPLAGFKYKHKTHYIYIRGEDYHICQSKANVEVYNLSRKGDIGKFELDWYYTLNEAIREDCITFSEYSEFNLIYNYKKILKK